MSLDGSPTSLAGAVVRWGLHRSDGAQVLPEKSLGSGGVTIEDGELVADLTSSETVTLARGPLFPRVAYHR